MTQRNKDAQNKNVINMDEETLSSVLSAGLYRSDCPDTMQLGDFHAGMLGREEQLGIQAHVEKCPHCQAELAQLVNFLAVEDEPIPVSTGHKEEADWIKASGFVWQRISETGQILLRFVADSLSTPSYQLTPIGVKGHSTTQDEPDVLRRIIVSPDQVDDLDMEAVIYKQDEQARLVIRVEIPSRWPDIAGVQVQATAGTWQAEGVTNDAGQIILTGLPLDLVDQVEIAINP